MRVTEVCDLRPIRSVVVQDCLRGEISRDREKAGDLRAPLFLSVCGR